MLARSRARASWGVLSIALHPKVLLVLLALFVLALGPRLWFGRRRRARR